MIINADLHIHSHFSRSSGDKKNVKNPNSISDKINIEMISQSSVHTISLMLSL